MKRTVPVFLAAVVVSLMLATSSHAENVSIKNGVVRVAVSPEKGAVEATDLASGKTFIRNPYHAPMLRSLEAGEISDPTWGDGEEMRVAWANGWKTTLRVYEGSPFIQMQTTVVNEGQEPFVVASLPISEVNLDLGVPVNQLKSFGTDFVKPLDEPITSFSFTALVDPTTRNGVVAGQLTHDVSSGVFTTEVKDGTPVIRCREDFGRFQVLPGKSRATDTLLIGYFDDARLGLEAYADAVVKQYGIELRPEPVVYCTWYHAGGSTEQKFNENVQFAAKELAPFGQSVMQIDDKWQRLTPSFIPAEKETQKRGSGPIKTFVESNETYPRGMAWTAEETAKLGQTPGIWFMPFAGGYRTAYFADKQDLFAHWPDGTPIEDPRWSGTLLDCSNPKTRDFVHERVKRIYDWGYRYFKIDGLHTGAITHNVYVNTGWREDGYANSENFIGRQDAAGKVNDATPSTALYDPNATHIEAFRLGLDTLSDAAPEAYVLGCNVSQNMRSMGAAFDKIDAMRIGPDNGSAGRGDWKAVTKGARHGTSLYFLNDRVWRNDPDPVYVRESNPMEYARWMVSWVAVTGSMLTSSYQFAELPPERLDLLKRTMPGHDLKPRPVDLFESENARIWLLTDDEGDVRRDVIGLFNWSADEPDHIVYEMERLGLDGETEYVGFDFWANEFIKPFKGTLDQTLPGGTCRILAVRAVADYPQLLSTSRHITQGVIDVLEEEWDPATMTLSGKSLVVAGDPYEMRIALPSEGEWAIEDAETNAPVDDFTVGERDELGVRVTFTPRETGEIAWRVRFKK